MERLRKIIVLFLQSIKGEEQDYTTGSINRAIFLLSVPMILEMVMESLFAVVDVFFVSRISEAAVATVGLTETVLTLIYSIAIGLSMAATAMVARRVGEKNYQEAGKAGLHTIYIGLALSVLIALIGLFFSEDILKLMGAQTEVVQQGKVYTKWMLGGNLTIMMLFLINGIFRGAGNAKIAMNALILSNGLNIILDPLLIFGPSYILSKFGVQFNGLDFIEGMGIEGAAIATNIGRGVAVLYQIWHLTRSRHQVHLVKTPTDWSLITKLLTVSAGGTGQFLIASASWVFLVRIMSSFGSEALAGYTIGIRVIIFAIMPAFGMANAAATLVGQNLGAGLPERAEISAWRAAFMNLIFLGMVTVVFYLGAGYIIGKFTQNPNVLKYGKDCLQVVCLGYVFYAYGMVIVQCFNGAGDTKTPTILNLFGFWMFQIPLAYSLAVVFKLGPTGVYMAIAIAESCIAIAAIILFKRGTWKKVAI